MSNLNQPGVSPNFFDRIPGYLNTLKDLKSDIEGDANFYVNATPPKLEKTLEKLNELIRILES